MNARVTGAVLALGVTAGGVAPALAQDEVNLYSYRQEYLIRPMLEVFERETGIKTNVVFAKEGMLERLKAEGMNSPADAILTVDISRLIAHKDAGVLQAVESKVLEDNIPAQYRDPEGYWYGLTLRARVIVHHEERVDPAKVATYEALADPDLGYRVCTRSGKHVYMQSLMASLIEHHGADAALEWAEGVVANMGRKPQGNDRAQIRAIAAGECDVALVNHYYVAKMWADEEEADAVEHVGIIFPNQDGRGTHVNISGAAVTKAASERKANAIRLLEFLSGDLAQRMYAETNYEYPVKSGTPWSALIESWGTFEMDEVSLAEVAGHATEAPRIYDRAGYQ